jgi:hypothetical protein
VAAISGTTPFVFTVGLSAPSAQTVTVDYATQDDTGSAARNDYIAASGTLTFAPGQVSQSITVDAVDNTRFGPAKTFHVVLSNAVNADIAADTGTGTITNSNPPPSVSIDSVVQAEGTGATTAVVFTVSLSQASDEITSVDYQTRDGTATLAHGDYEIAAGTLVFNPGVTTQTMTVQVNNGAIQPNDGFFVDLSNPSDATIGQGTGLATIVASSSSVPTGTVSPTDPPTSTALSSSAPTSFANEPVTFTAVVTSSGTGTPTGSVTFFDSNAPLASPTLTVVGGVDEATLTTSSLGVGTHTISAVYSGDSIFGSSTSPGLSQTVQLIGTTTTLALSSVNPSVVDQPVTFTATVAPEVTGLGTPQGNVTFYGYNSEFGSFFSIGSGALDASGTATVTTSSLSAATTMILAMYTGNSSFAGSRISLPLTQNVQLIGTTTTLTSSPNPAIGQFPTVTFTASVSPAQSGFGAPQGTVDFFQDYPTTGYSMIGSATLDASGTATLSTVNLGGSITAVYAGAGSFAGSASAPLLQAAQLISTMTSLSASLTQANVGQPITFTATVTAPAGSGTPQGTVNFIDMKTGATLATAVPLDASGTATFSTAALLAGPHVIVANYGNFGASGNFGPSVSSPVTETIIDPSAPSGLVPTTTTVTTSLNPSVFGQPLTITATVTPTQAGSGVPQGTVNFYENLVQIGSATLDASGTATLTTTTSLAPGTYTLMAFYPDAAVGGGGTQFAASAGSISQTVQRIDTTTSLSSSVNPAAVTQDVTFTATVTPARSDFGAPTGAVTFYEMYNGGYWLMGSSPLDTSGTATFDTATLSGFAAILWLQAGSHTVVASYDGSSDGSFNNSQSTPLLQTLHLTDTSTSLTTTLTPTRPRP